MQSHISRVIPKPEIDIFDRRYYDLQYLYPAKRLYEKIPSRRNIKGGNDICYYALAGIWSEAIMGRKKGSLTPEQKARMQAGRKKAREKAEEGIIGDTEKVKREKKQEVIIIGYCIECDSVLPIFSSEKNSFKGIIYKTTQEAKENL